MKFLIMVACTLAVSTAHVFITASYTGQPYLHHQQLPVPIAINGVPVDTVEVQNANAAHFAAKAQAQARNSNFPDNAHYQESQATSHNVPVDTVEVQQAKHAHFAHKAAVYARKELVVGDQENSGQQHNPAVSSGIPVDTIEVPKAKEAHFVHKARVYARNGQKNVQTIVDTSIVNPVYTGPQHIPVIGPNGVPVDTVEVQHAKEAHLAYTATAHARAVSNEEQPKETEYNVGDILPIYPGEVYFPEIINGVPEDAAEYQLIHSVQNARSGVTSDSQQIQSEQAGHHHAYAGPIHHPVIGVNGVPVDTIEVQHAKKVHFVEKAKAHARTGSFQQIQPVSGTVSHQVNEPVYSGPVHHPVIDVSGVPVDTIEVQQAKQAHFAEKAKANVRSGFKTDSHQIKTDDKTSLYSGALHYPIIVNGVPLDTTEVQKAKEAHLIHTTNAQTAMGEEHSQSTIATHNGLQHHLGHVEVTHNYHSVPVVVNNMQTIYPGAQNYPVFGVPVPEHGKSTKFTHKYIPQVRTSVPYPSYPVLQHIPVPAPVISTQIVNGVPVDTPAVQQAKAAHFAAKARAYAQHGAYSYETPVTKQ